MSQSDAHTAREFRRWSAKGKPVARSFMRACQHCRADFLGLAFGKTGQVGLWNNTGRWWCSIECYDLTYGAGAAQQLITGTVGATDG